MKKPYIFNYADVIPLEKSSDLFYDNKTQVNYLDSEYKSQAIISRKDKRPQTTILTETVENGDDEIIFKSLTFGPSTTRITFVVEQDDENEAILFSYPDTTKETRTIENSDTE